MTSAVALQNTYVPIYLGLRAVSRLSVLTYCICKVDKWLSLSVKCNGKCNFLCKTYDNTHRFRHVYFTLLMSSEFNMEFWRSEVAFCSCRVIYQKVTFSVSACWEAGSHGLSWKYFFTFLQSLCIKKTWKNVLNSKLELTRTEPSDTLSFAPILYKNPSKPDHVFHSVWITSFFSKQRSVRILDFLRNQWKLDTGVLV